MLSTHKTPFHNLENPHPSPLARGEGEKALTLPSPGVPGEGSETASKLIQAFSLYLPVIAAILILGGCQRIANTPPDAINSTPIAMDDAMKQRDWPVDVSYYANGAVVAYPVGFLFEPEYNRAEWQYIFIDTPLFLGQAIILPITLAIENPASHEEYRGATIPPTYTANPPLK
jgi:hypothetical protein